MDTTVAGLTVALVLVVIGGALLWRSQSRNANARASLKFGDLFSAEVELGPQQEARAEQAVREAESVRGVTFNHLPAVPRAQDFTKLARILWIDDHPDNNLYETVAFENVGRFVTAAASTDAGLSYLDELEFSVAITDVERAGDPTAAEEFIKQARVRGHQLPIVVYTSNAAARRTQLIAAGAEAVVDLPSDLIRQVDQLIRRQ